jgi:response regulator of citrate/malate metabolism
MQNRIRQLDTEMNIYLGDSVYAGFDGFNIVLTTNNGEGATNVIFLEPFVLIALDLYRKRVNLEGP